MSNFWRSILKKSFCCFSYSFFYDMSMQLLVQFQQSHPHLFRDTNVNHAVSEFSIVDRTLRRGEKEDIHELFSIMGKEKVKELFLKILLAPKSDFPPKAIPFYLHYFNIDAALSGNLVQRTKWNAFFYKPIRR